SVKAIVPSKEAAQLEADKWFAKELMRHQAVPTAEAKVFTDANAAEAYIRAREEPVVIKAAGLAKGKGVSVCYRTSDAIEAIDTIMRKGVFGAAGERVLDGLVREGIDYRGVLYAGLMLTANGPKVLEFNCRFGDPECQPLMMRLKSDLLEAMLAVADRKLDQIELHWDPRPAVCVVATSKGYPRKYETGLPISGIE